MGFILRKPIASSLPGTFKYSVPHSLYFVFKQRVCVCVPVTVCCSCFVLFSVSFFFSFVVVVVVVVVVVSAGLCPFLLTYHPFSLSLSLSPSHTHFFKLFALSPIPSLSLSRLSIRSSISFSHTEPCGTRRHARVGCCHFPEQKVSERNLMDRPKVNFVIAKTKIRPLAAY